MKKENNFRHKASRPENQLPKDDQQMSASAKKKVYTSTTTKKSLIKFYCKIFPYTYLLWNSVQYFFFNFHFILLYYFPVNPDPAVSSISKANTFSSQNSVFSSSALWFRRKTAKPDSTLIPWLLNPGGMASTLSQLCLRGGNAALFASSGVPGLGVLCRGFGVSALLRKEVYKRDKPHVNIGKRSQAQAPAMTLILFQYLFSDFSWHKLEKCFLFCSGHWWCVAMWFRLDFSIQKALASSPCHYFCHFCYIYHYILYYYYYTSIFLYFDILFIISIWIYW